MTFKNLQDICYDMCMELTGLPGWDIAKVKLYINRGERDFLRQTKQHQREIDAMQTLQLLFIQSSGKHN